MTQDSLEHYGVLGMKWGVRKDAKKATSKAYSKLGNFEKKESKYRSKSDKLMPKALERQVDAQNAILFKKSKQKKATKLAKKTYKQNQKANRQQAKAYRFTQNMKKILGDNVNNPANDEYKKLGEKYLNLTLNDLRRNANDSSKWLNEYMNSFNTVAKYQDFRYDVYEDPERYRT